MAVTFSAASTCSAIGTQSGGNAAALIDKLLALKHASVAVGCNNTKLYHLCSRPFYATLGEEDNRNRRERPPFAIKNRLMGLDFVLGHPENTYLATEREKVDFFTGTLGIDRSLLPIKRFVSQQSKATTDRYFVDKYPIFITPSEDKQSPRSVVLLRGRRRDHRIEIWELLAAVPIPVPRPREV